MKKLMILFLFCHLTSAVKHSMKLYLMGSSGVPNIPEFMAISDLKEVIITYYDSNIKTIEPRHGWTRKFMEDDPQYWEMLNQAIMRHQQHFKVETDSFKQRSNKTGGVHINQEIMDCKWDDETEKVEGYNQYGYNGEDFLTFDLETETWVAINPWAEITKQKWNGNKAYNLNLKTFLIITCTAWLKKWLNYGKSLLQRTDLPSVSLLQKTPSSPVTCHATGFYPDRAMMFWRKDGEELHEDVDHGEILPNNDGSFQMSVDLKPPSVTPEDWRRFDCVFQLSGVNKDIVTKLDKAAIRTNWEKPFDMNIVIIAAVAVLAVVLMVATGFIVYKKNKAKCPPYAPDNTSEFTEKLNPES